MRKVKTEAVKKLDHSERWLGDGLAISRPPAFSLSLEVDVSRVRELIGRARENGLHLTYAHVLVRAVALVLSANPGMHVMVCGRKVHCPTEVDIGLSISAETCVTPVLVIESASRKSLAAIVDEVTSRVPVSQAQHEKMLTNLKHWGWLFPFGFMRRGLLKFLFRFFEFRRKGSGTFQVSIMPGVDTFTTPMFNTCGILTAGRVRDRVIAAGGVPLVRPTVHLTCSADHRVWNGGDCQTFLLAVQEVLVNGSLERELELAI